MAGALLHLAMGDPRKWDPDSTEISASRRRAYALGLLLPDIAKQGFIRGPEDLSRYFQGCLAGDRPSYDVYLRFPPAIISTRTRATLPGRIRGTRICAPSRWRRMRI